MVDTDADGANAEAGVEVSLMVSRMLPQGETLTLHHRLPHPRTPLRHRR